MGHWARPWWTGKPRPTEMSIRVSTKNPGAHSDGPGATVPYRQVQKNRSGALTRIFPIRCFLGHLLQDSVGLPDQTPGLQLRRIGWPAAESRAQRSARDLDGQVVFGVRRVRLDSYMSIYIVVTCFSLKRNTPPGWFARESITTGKHVHWYCRGHIRKWKYTSPFWDGFQTDGWPLKVSFFQPQTGYPQTRHPIAFFWGDPAKCGFPCGFPSIQPQTGYPEEKDTACRKS